MVLKSSDDIFLLFTKTVGVPLTPNLADANLWFPSIILNNSVLLRHNLTSSSDNPAKRATFNNPL